MKTAKKRKTDTKKADTRPTKSFLVEDVTKDIKIEDAIADLIDNAIDSFSVGEGGNVTQPRADYTGCAIDLSITHKFFSIADNGSGISSNKLEKDALRFGSKSNNSFGIGTFGVGLNRAIFKIGKEIKITTETTSERSIINLNADQYLKDDGNWNIDFDTEAATGKTGTTIEINKILTSEHFGDSNFINELKNKAQKLYSRFIECGLSLRINGKAIQPMLLGFREDSDFSTQCSEFTEDDVSIKVELGQHKDHFFSYEKKKGKNSAKTSEFGWYVYCNNRAILAADWSDLVGWEVGEHSQYYGFIGIVTFDGETKKLPWNTSKSAPDLNNLIYRKALSKIKKQSQDWRSHTSKAKSGAFNTNKGGGGAPTNGSKPPSPIPPGGGTNPPHPFADHNYLLGGKTRPKTKLDFFVPNDQIKLRAAFNEVISLDLTKFPLSAAVMLRIIVEMSTLYYKKKKSMSYQNKLYLREQVEKMADHMLANGFLEKAEKNTIDNLCVKKGGVISVDYLQSCIHEPKTNVLPKDSILSFWYDIHPYIKACLTS